MKTTPALFCYALLLCASLACKKETPVPAPAANFTINGNTATSVTIGTYDQYSLINKSNNAETFLWDLGNGITSTAEKTVLTYSKAGTYKLSLKATNVKGETSVSYRTIKVVEPIIKQVVVKTLNWNVMPGRPVLTKANLWIEIVKAESGKDYPVLDNGSFAAPLVYKSNILTNVASETVPLVFNLPEELVIDIPTLTGNYGYKGRGYGFNLYAQDSSGTYLLSSNFWSGIGIRYQGIIADNTFTILTGAPGIAIDFIGGYR